MSGFGQQTPMDGGSEFNATEFLIRQILGTVRTCVVVEVMGVTNTGTVIPAGYVDVRPLVNQIDGAGNAVPHETIYGLPYFRLQAGGNAIIIDPQVGDIGPAIIADRDISAVKAAKKAANPGSLRRFDLADGMYFGGILNGAPTQYVEFSADGIRIHSPAQVNLDAPDVLIDAQTVEINASTSATITTAAFTVNGTAQINGGLGVTGNTSFGGGAKAVVLDGDPVSGGVVHATSTTIKAT